MLRSASSGVIVDQIGQQICGGGNDGCELDSSQVCWASYVH